MSDPLTIGTHSDSADLPRAVVGVSLKMYFGMDDTLAWCSRAGAVEAFVLPSFPMLSPAVRALAGTTLAVGAQDLYWMDGGPFTGEVSGATLAEIGCRYVAVGHAERRRLFGDTDKNISLKVDAALRNELCPVICVGEAVRVAAPAASRRCMTQLAAALSVADARGAGGRVIVAYEPQWAIGSDRPASASHIAAVCSALRSLLEAGRSREGSSVIYGGSAGAGLFGRLDGVVDGLFLGRHAHDPAGLTTVLDDIAKSGRLIDPMQTATGREDA